MHSFNFASRTQGKPLVRSRNTTTFIKLTFFYHKCTSLAENISLHFSLGDLNLFGIFCNTFKYLHINIHKQFDPIFMQTNSFMKHFKTCQFYHTNVESKSSFLDFMSILCNYVPSISIFGSFSEVKHQFSSHLTNFICVLTL